jgi:hypothetical protein
VSTTSTNSNQTATPIRPTLTGSWNLGRENMKRLAE